MRCIEKHFAFVSRIESSVLPNKYFNTMSLLLLKNNFCILFYSSANKQLEREHIYLLSSKLQNHNVNTITIWSQLHLKLYLNKSL